MKPFNQAEQVSAFWRRVDVSGGAMACWLWAGGSYVSGYGAFRWGGRSRTTHRVALELHLHRALSPGAHVLHSCDNKACVNPAHLREGTNADNIRDKVERGGAPRGEGHLGARLTEADVYSIRAAAAGGLLSDATIARRYGVVTGTVQAIRERRSWSWLPEVAC